MKIFEARLEAVCLSVVGVRVAKAPQDEASLGPHGFSGDRHAVEFVRLRTGQRLPNQRQWSAVSTEEVEALCSDLSVPPFAPGALGENLRLSGLALAGLPPGSVLAFPSGARLRVSDQNVPCINAALELAQSYGAIVRDGFVRSAYGRRGVVGSVLVPGLVRTGDVVQIVVEEPAETATQGSLPL